MTGTLHPTSTEARTSDLPRYLAGKRIELRRNGRTLHSTSWCPAAAHAYPVRVEVAATPQLKYCTECPAASNADVRTLLEVALCLTALAEVESGEALTPQQEDRCMQLLQGARYGDLRDEALRQGEEDTALQLRRNDAVETLEKRWKSWTKRTGGAQVVGMVTWRRYPEILDPIIRLYSILEDSGTHLVVAPEDLAMFLEGASPAEETDTLEVYETALVLLEDLRTGSENHHQLPEALKAARLVRAT